MTRKSQQKKEKAPPVEARDEQLLAFLRIANAMLEATDLDQILGVITREVHRVIRIDRSSVAFLEPGRKALVLRNVYKGDSVKAADEGREVPIDETTVIGWVALHMQPVMRSEIAGDTRFQDVAREEPLRSDIIVPLVARGRLLGTLNVGSYRPGAFSHRDIDLLEGYGKFASVAIEHTMLRLEAQASGQRYQALQENANDMIMIIDKNTGRIIEGNHKCETVLGRSREQLVGTPYVSLFAEEDQAQARRDLVNIVSHKSMAAVDRQMKSRDGHVIWVDVNANLIEIKRDLFIQVILHNVSQRRLLEQQIILQNKYLQQVNKKITEVDRMKTEFLANISHELRTPLSIIIAYTESLRDASISSEERSKFISVIVENGENLLGLINNLLDLSKLEISGQKLSMSLSHVHDVVRSIWPELEKKAEEKGIILSFLPGADVPVTYVDNGQMGRVLLSLIQNAIKFTEPGGYVQVRTALRRSEIRIDVEDTGRGIRREELHGIFEAFHQVDGSSSRKWGGLGIGLALVKHIVELHRGQLLVRSEYGKGSTFTIVLPLDTEEVFLRGGSGLTGDVELNP